MTDKQTTETIDPPRERAIHFLAPRYWLTWLGFGFLRLMICLPHAVLRGMSYPLGYILRQLMRRRVHIARVNLTLCFPALSVSEREILLKRNFRFLAMGLFEMGLAWWGSSKRIRKLVRVENLPAIEALLAEGRGIVGITAHFTPLELFIRRMSEDLPTCAFYRAQKNRLFEWYSSRIRARYVTSLVERKDVRGFFQALGENLVIGYLPDQDYGLKYGVFAPFFGVPAATVVALRTFLETNPAPLAAAFIHYEPQGAARYVIRCEPVARPYPTADEQADAEWMNALVEQAIRRYPAQYMWQHRRFKNRPPGVPYPY